MTVNKAYFASPLFTQAEYDFNEKVVSYLREMNDNVTIYLPQENASINDKNAYASSQDILKGDIDELSTSDVLIAILDGQTIDPGVAAEVGYAYASGITIIGVITDSRIKGATNIKKLGALGDVGENQFFYHNLFVTGMAKTNYSIATTMEEVSEILDCLFPNTETQTPIDSLGKHVFYVDGSFMPTISEEYAGWSFCSEDGLHEGFGKVKDNGMRNVQGEIHSVIEVLKFAKKNGIKEVEICYDYQGIEKWITRDWKASKPHTQRYVREVDEFIGVNAENPIKIKFTKVKGHSGNIGNDRADLLAKEGLTKGLVGH